MVTRPSSLILLHGFGSSFDHNWRQTGWVDILADFGVTVPVIDLPGHGSSLPLTDPEDYADADEEIRRVLPADGLISGVGFSAGAELLVACGPHRATAVRPDRPPRVGRQRVRDPQPRAIVAALESSEEPEDVQARLFRRLAQSAGNDPRALSAFLRRPRRPVTEEDLSSLHFPILVVLGDRDMVGSADRLMSALPSASLVTLAGVDHFATPSDFGAIDATVKFLGLG